MRRVSEVGGGEKSKKICYQVYAVAVVVLFVAMDAMDVVTMDVVAAYSVNIGDVADIS